VSAIAAASAASQTISIRAFSTAPG